MPPSTVFIDAVRLDFAAPRLGDVVGDVGGERRFAHARSPGEDDEVGCLQTAHQPVEILQPRRQARQVAIALVRGTRHVDGVEERRFESVEAGVVVAALGELEQALFGVLDLRRRRLLDRRVVGNVDHVLADADQRAANGEVVDRAPVVLRVDDCRCFRSQPRQILREVDIAD